MEALKTIETVNGNQTKNDFEGMNTETAQSNKVKDVETLRESFETALRDADSKRRLPKCYYSTFDQDKEFNNLLFEEYKQIECIQSLNTVRTLLAVELLQDMFTINFKEPQRTAQAISKLLETVDPYIKDKIVNDIAKDNYFDVGKERGFYTDWIGAKVKLNIELLAPKEASN